MLCKPDETKKDGKHRLTYLAILLRLRPRRRYIIAPAMRKSIPAAILFTMMTMGPSALVN